MSRLKYYFPAVLEILVLGCTEIPVILAQAVKEQPSRYIDLNGVTLFAPE